MRWTLPLCGLVAATSLLLPPRSSQAFTTIGGSLDTTQRDVRVFNNFTDASANDNTTPSLSFPGYDGAELAIWKAVVEWSSELHGSGFGDPVQPAGIGSGGANFDPSWQGNAGGVGTTDENIHSELSGEDGGVLAFTETPISNGWRIRYYSIWSWRDGPDAGISGIDLQGVACHEYGHALGLGHTSIAGSTMTPAISGNGSGQRSIESDDIAGIKSVYGVKSASKPRILSTSQTGLALTLNGQNFTSTNNEVWFTKTGTGGTGTPIKLTGVASTSGGTKITVNVPATAGSGDVLVKKNASGNSSLSNAYPFNLAGGPLEGGPTISGTNPQNVPAIALGANTFVVQGSGLASVGSVTVDGIAASFDDGNDTALTITLPLLDKLGSVPIEITTSEGHGSTAVNVVAPATPVLTLDPPVLLNGQSLTVREGAAPGDIAYLLVSTQLAPSLLPGILSLDIGAGLTDLVLFKTNAIPSKAWLQQSTPIFGLPAGTTLYVQLAVYHTAAPSLPLASSNFTSALVVF